ncbi:uncharacterized protein EI90DRAFT_2431433 [Cantharellus anzutake]|uniref:uncharacterized protein n=1 Tax=Cantharellus anzutake TaxID=1750568 RepID=UPI001902E290|nr:uncharacterized protein EI90DRAFT_2431433 [Cantharellus anzutake]KAF8338941.1 hypothetical protein EI90DRAFT_2431433 [Cantharellus anzutake]
MMLHAAFSVLIAYLACVAADLVVVPSTLCTTVSSGILRTATGRVLNFGFTGNSPVLRFGAGNGMAAEFHSCRPNWGGFNGQGRKATGGHLVITSTHKCLSWRSTTARKLKIEQRPCSMLADRSQLTQNFVRESDGSIYFAGRWVFPCRFDIIFMLNVDLPALALCNLMRMGTQHKFGNRTGLSVQADYMAYLGKPLEE